MTFIDTGIKISRVKRMERQTQVKANLCAQPNSFMDSTELSNTKSLQEQNILLPSLLLVGNVTCLKLV